MELEAFLLCGYDGSAGKSLRGLRRISVNQDLRLSLCLCTLSGAQKTTANQFECDINQPCFGSVPPRDAEMDGCHPSEVEWISHQGALFPPEFTCWSLCATWLDDENHETLFVWHCLSPPDTHVLMSAVLKPDNQTLWQALCHPLSLFFSPQTLVWKNHKGLIIPNSLA